MKGLLFFNLEICNRDYSRAQVKQPTTALELSCASMSAVHVECFATVRCGERDACE